MNGWFMELSEIVFDVSSPHLYLGEAGVKFCNHILVNNKNGCVFYGPYIFLPVGTYKLQFNFLWEEYNFYDNKSFIDITTNKGATLISKKLLSDFVISEGDDYFFEMTFTINRIIDSIEIRLFVSDVAKFTFINYKLQYAFESEITKRDYLKWNALQKLHNYTKNILYQMNITSYDKICSDVIVMQTSDPVNYRPLLDLTGSNNYEFCKKYSIKYEQYVGLKMGFYPFQAMFNRVFMLNELLLSGFSGWVFYLDADAYFCNFEFDILGYLEVLRDRKKHFLLFREHGSQDRPLSLSVNSGAFAFDLSSSEVHATIKSWHHLYSSIYNELDFFNANSWGAMINDQDSLRIILKTIPCIEDKVEFYENGEYGYIVDQVTRSQELSEDSLSHLNSRLVEIKKRIGLIKK